MKQTARIISTYSADVFGVCSALFELGGMVIMHDASGCNSTYTTHDEPRWYDMDSMVYISGLSEMEAIMGDDQKLINDIIEAAEELHPAFIAVAGTPIPVMTGVDLESIAWMLEQQTGIPSFGFSTTGMHSYEHGISMAFEAYAKRFVKKDVEKTSDLSANILGLTPLDFSVNGADVSIEAFLHEAGFHVISKWAMGSTPEQLSQAGRAHVNLVVSAGGIKVAEYLKETFGTPYVIGVPYGSRFAEKLKTMLYCAVQGNDDEMEFISLPDEKILIVGEGITSLSLAQAIEMECGKGTKVICTTELNDNLLRKKDQCVQDEESIEEILKDSSIMIADPLYRPICPERVKFVPLPSESFSGRLFRKDIPNLVENFDEFKREAF